MSARDEVRGILSNTVCNVSFYPKLAQPYLLGGDMSRVLDRAADELIAAGYCKPRTIRTAEELEALFQGDANVVLLDEDGVSLQNLAGGWQSSTGSRRLMSSDLTFHCFGPTFTVLHEGEIK